MTGLTAHPQHRAKPPVVLTGTERRNPVPVSGYPLLGVLTAAKVNELGLTKGNVVIPEGYVEIDTSAFNYSVCAAVTGVKFPSTLKKIKSTAFYNVGGLTGTLVIPDSVEEIEDAAFMSCAQLTGLTLGSGLKKIGTRAFSGCSKLTGMLVISDSVEDVEASARMYDDAKKGLVGRVDASAFSGCDQLTGLILGSSLKMIGPSAFAGCKNLTGTLVIPDSVEAIEANAFLNCTLMGFNVLKPIQPDKAAADKG